MSQRYIKEEDGKWNVYSEEGKLLGSHPTKAEAQKQLDAIEAHKHMEHKSYLPSLEVRSMATEVRMVEMEDGRKLIRGYAAVFNARSQVLSEDDRQFREYIKPGAFQRSLAEADVRALFNHDTRSLLGRKGAGTLRLYEDEHGLRYEIDPPDTTTGRDVVEMLRRGDLTGSSFGFATIADNWTTDADGMDLRELREVHLFDVGPVTFPAYTQASAAYRSLDRVRAEAEAAVEPAAPTITFPTPDQSVRLLRLRLASF